MDPSAAAPQLVECLGHQAGRRRGRFVPAASREEAEGDRQGDDAPTSSTLARRLARPVIGASESSPPATSSYLIPYYLSGLTGEKDHALADPQPAGREPEPGRLGLLQAFLNSRFDLSDPGHGDLLTSPGALAA